MVRVVVGEAVTEGTDASTANTAARQQSSKDSVSPQKRSETMSRVKSKNTKPELRVRSALHAMGYRFRLHRKDLPGNPDIVLPKHRMAVFVHGCFWHQHPGCRKATIPQNNREYWEKKLGRNVQRDERARRALAEQGWRGLTLWECEIPREEEALEERLRGELSPTTTAPRRSRPSGASRP